MNKKNNRKGFTIVELVIVIAVIAVLATVLVPTFGNVIAKANRAAALQEAKNVYTNYVTENAEKGAYEEDLIIKVAADQYVAIIDGAVTEVYETYDAAKTPVQNDIATEKTGTLTYAWATDAEGVLTVTVTTNP